MVTLVDNTLILNCRNKTLILLELTNTRDIKVHNRSIWTLRVVSYNYQLLLVSYSITWALLHNKYTGAKSSALWVNRLLQECYNNKGPLKRPYKYHGFTNSIGTYILNCKLCCSTLQKCRGVRVGSSKYSVCLKDPTNCGNIFGESSNLDCKYQSILHHRKGLVKWCYSWTLVFLTRYKS